MPDICVCGVGCGVLCVCVCGMGVGVSSSAGRRPTIERAASWRKGGRKWALGSSGFTYTHTHIHIIILPATLFYSNRLRLWAVGFILCVFFIKKAHRTQHWTPRAERGAFFFTYVSLSRWLALFL